MYKQESKQCGRCGLLFICKPGDIQRCQCRGIQLSDEEKIHIGKKFKDCLCVSCLLAMQREYESPGE